MSVSFLTATAALIAKRDALVPPSAEAADEFVALQDELANRAPVLVAALEAVLALTVSHDRDDRDLDGNPEQPLVCLVRCDKVRTAVESALRDAQGGQS